MSKSRSTKWYDRFENDYDYEYGKKKNRRDERRNKKKMKNALREKNLSYFDQDEEQYE